MNVIVEKLAKQSLVAAVTEDKYINIIFPFKKVRVSIKGKKVAGNVINTMSDYCVRVLNIENWITNINSKCLNTMAILEIGFRTWTG